MLAQEFPLKNWLDKISKNFSDRSMLVGGSVMKAAAVRALELLISLTAAV